VAAAGAVVEAEAAVAEAAADDAAREDQI